MISILKGQTKKVYFYLGTQSYALFNLKSNDTDRITLIGATNGSPSSAYSWFTFSEGSGLSASGGFTLDEGTYNVEIWSGSPGNLNIGGGNLLSRDLLEVRGTGSTFIWKPESTTDYVYYNPDAQPPSGLTGNNN
jgi:hypothetical protein